MTILLFSLYTIFFFDILFFIVISSLSLFTVFWTMPHLIEEQIKDFNSSLNYPDYKIKIGQLVLELKIITNNK